MRARSKIFGVLAVGAGLSAMALASPAKSADHKDAPATTADPASDINDVFSFLDGTNFVMAMTVSPFAAKTAKFSDKTQYVFHTSSGAAFGTTTSDVNFICTFDVGQKASCWAGTADYVTGDASNAATPLTSASGKIKLFAGLRSDPFFFNLQGFKDTVSAVEGAAAPDAGLTFDTSGCPNVGGPTATALQNLLKETTSTAAPTKTEADDFSTANSLAIVLVADRSLVNKGGPIVSVWASTNKGQ
jgi:Domain of unknown function (DUF4331)